MNVRVDGKSAFISALSNKSSKWPARGGSNRLEPLCVPVLDPKHTINASDKIFTIGSCFARNIEAALKQHAFDVPSSDVVFPQEELWGKTKSHAGLLNKYTPQSILNELEYVFEDKYLAEDFLIEGVDGKFYDMQLHTNYGVSLERGIERRQQIKELIHGFLTQSDVVIVTLGLIEVWWDSWNNVYLNEMPSKGMIEKYEGRFFFEVMSPQDVFDKVERIITLLKKYSRKENWIMLTVSPVPLARTFRDKDVIMSNTYSKSLLRVAAEIESEKHDFVEYFPSYESVVHSERSGTWMDDQIHIKYSIIKTITERMVDHYCVK